MASPVPPLDLFAAKFAVVTKLALLTHGFVFALFVFCGKVFAHLPGLPPVTLPLFLLRGLLGALAVIATQLVLQQKCGCSGGQLRAVCLQLHLLAGDDVPSGMAAFTPGGCAGIKIEYNIFLHIRSGPAGLNILAFSRYITD